MILLQQFNLHQSHTLILIKKALEKTAAQFEDKQKIVPEQLLEKKEEIQKVISGINVLNKNSQLGLVTGVKVNLDNAETFLPQLPVESLISDPLSLLDISVDNDLNTLSVTSPTSMPLVSFSTENNTVFTKKDDEISKLIQLLAHYQLWAFDNTTGEKLTKAFFDLGVKLNVSTLSLGFSKEFLLENPKFDLGLLVITQEEKTILLFGEHKHVVLLYTNLENQKIIWGYLTLNKSEKNFMLSNQQPFQDQPNNINDTNAVTIVKQQYVHILETPLIAKDSYINTLPQDMKQTGDDYLKTILHKVNEMFKKFVVPKLTNSHVNIYDGKGFTEEMIKKMVLIHEQKEGKLAQKWLNEYIYSTNEKKFL